MPRRGSSGFRSLAVAASFFLGAGMAFVLLVVLQEARADPTGNGAGPGFSPANGPAVSDAHPNGPRSTDPGAGPKSP
jgi:hypothetical protein